MLVSYVLSTPREDKLGQEWRANGAIGLRPAQECNCSRAEEENKVTGATCECGKRPADKCMWLGPFDQCL